MLKCIADLPSVRTAYRKKPFDRQIDQLVYELYGLTEEEVRIVEGKEVGLIT